MSAYFQKRIQELRAQQDQTAAAVANMAQRLIAMEGALTALVDHYVGLVTSGDCGNWDPEKEPVVTNARAALAAAGDF